MQVRETLISWLNYMTRPRNLGFSSLRFDFVRGYDPKYVKEYVDSTVRAPPPPAQCQLCPMQLSVAAF